MSINDSSAINNVTASISSIWQRRGFSSSNGVVTAIASGKYVDIETNKKL